MTDHDSGCPERATTRRDLLFGGVALAASGLLLPADLAAERGRGRKPGELRGRRRDRREEREDRREARRDDPPPRGIFTRDVWFTIENRGQSDLHLRYWRFSLRERWETWGGFGLEAGSSCSANGNEGLVVQVDDARWVEGFNPVIGFPFVAIGEGGWTNRGEEDGKRLVQRGLGVGDRVAVDRLGLDAVREPDSRAFIQFRLTIA